MTLIGEVGWSVASEAAAAVHALLDALESIAFKNTA